MKERTFLFSKDVTFDDFASDFRELENFRGDPEAFAAQLEQVIEKMKAAGVQEDTITLELERMRKSIKKGTFAFAGIVWVDGENYSAKVFVEGKACRTRAVVAGAQMLAELQYQLEDEPCDHDEGYPLPNTVPLLKH